MKTLCADPTLSESLPHVVGVITRFWGEIINNFRSNSEKCRVLWPWKVGKKLCGNIFKIHLRLSMEMRNYEDGKFNWDILQMHANKFLKVKFSAWIVKFHEKSSVKSMKIAVVSCLKSTCYHSEEVCKWNVWIHNQSEMEGETEMFIKF